MPCEDCLTRRQFLASSAGAATLAALATACGDGEISGLGARGGTLDQPIVITVASFPELATTGRLVQVASIVAAKRTGLNTFDAFNMTCTHLQCLTNIVNGQVFDCPCHGSQFDANGNVIRSPAQSPLTKLATSYDAGTDKLTIS